MPALPVCGLRDCRASRTGHLADGRAQGKDRDFCMPYRGHLALTGCPGFSGYFSKDLIIAWAVVEKPILGWIAVATAGLTAFYMFRLLAAYLGPARSETAEHAHESPAVMIIPLILLAIPAFGAGYAGRADVFSHRGARARA